MASLVFIAPLLAVYEAGVLWLGPQALRNGADVWLRQFLELIGFGQYFLLPVLTVCILLSWHYTTRRPWRISGGVLSGMLIESVLLAMCLRAILHLQGELLLAVADPWTSAGQPDALALEVSDGLRASVGFLGAGVYEELLFRLILLSSGAWIVRQLGATASGSLAAAVGLSSLLFAMAHYVGPCGEPIQLFSFPFWFSFVFRFLAGVFFGLLFAYRGFGIAAGSHAGYDILVGVL